MGKQLVVISGLERGRVIRLSEADILQFGCSQNLDIHTRLRDPQVARVHCEVQVDGDKVVLIDAETPTGTFVNGKRICRHELQQGDVFRIGQTEIRYVSDDTVIQKASSPSSSTKTKIPAVGTERLQELVGKTLTHYEVGVVLGTGQNGCVFRAKDRKHNRITALKVLRPEFGKDDPTVRNFFQAVKATLSVCHPNLLAIHSAGKTGPYCWIAMEYVEGKSLTQVIRRIKTAGMLDWRIPLRVAIHLSRALQRAHESQLLHGNIAPQNILVRDKDKLTKLGDLMLATALQWTPVEPLTRPEEYVDNTPFMSPERTRGPNEIDARSDIYSLGATIYALLTGCPPFEGSCPGETVQKIRQQAEPIRPKRYQPTMHDLFEKTVRQMLAKRPQDRPSIEEFLPQLEQVAQYSEMKM